MVLASIFLSLTLALAYSDTTTHPDLTREIIDFYELSGGRKFTEEQKQTMLGIITAIATVVEISKQLKVIEDDPDDDVILETAVVGNVAKCLEKLRLLLQMIF